LAIGKKFNTIGYLKNRHFLPKIAKACGHNIGPCDFYPASFA
jgi:hypothetical protein